MRVVSLPRGLPQLPKIASIALQFKGMSQSGAIKIGGLSQFLLCCIKGIDTLFRIRNGVHSVPGSPKGLSEMGYSNSSGKEFFNLLFDIIDEFLGLPSLDFALMSPQDPDSWDQLQMKVGSSSRARNESASSKYEKSLSPKGVESWRSSGTMGHTYGWDCARRSHVDFEVGARLNVWLLRHISIGAGRAEIFRPKGICMRLMLSPRSANALLVVVGTGLPVLPLLAGASCPLSPRLLPDRVPVPGSFDLVFAVVLNTCLFGLLTYLSNLFLSTGVLRAGPDELTGQIQMKLAGVEELVHIFATTALFLDWTYLRLVLEIFKHSRGHCV
ncbi:hypothetical protein Tco_1016803 [Tanacetum coccineum]|uniref:Uncharacterized protein n=1 Tax=Tanacetum coccineum TaxID=301880 RepID=A0ABQ5FPQ3_9ASTR